MATHSSILGLPWQLRWQSIYLQCGRLGFNPWVRKILWRIKWQPTPVLLPRKSHGWRSVVGYSPWSHKESDMTERCHSVTQEQRPMGGGVSRLNVFCPFLNWSFSNERKCFNVFCPFLIGIFQMPLSDIWFANIFPSLQLVYLAILKITFSYFFQLY